MTDPRATVVRKGIKPEIETYTIDGSTITYDSTKAGGAAATMIGKAVTLSTHGTVALAADADPILGELVQVEWDGACSVKTRGYLSLPGGNGATLTPGTKIVGALNASSEKGYIRTCAAATLAEVNKSRGLIIDASVTTAVEVLF